MFFYPLKTFKSFGLLALCFLLSACNSLTTEQPVSIAHRISYPQFSLEGKISVKNDQKGSSGRFYWKHNLNSDQFIAYAPTGQIIGKIDANNQHAQLQLANNELIQAENLEDLLPQILHIHLPLKNIVSWIQATPTTSSRTRLYDQFGRPARYSDQGWVIYYKKYVSDAKTSLPKQFEMSYGNITIRLFIEQWNLPIPHSSTALHQQN